MQFLPHQIKYSDKAVELVKELGYVYIAGKPRSGKTATALRTAELTKAKRWLILCPKNAISGWNKFLLDKELGLSHNYYVTNYEQIGSYVKTPKGRMLPKLKLNPKDYDGVIIDESHRLGTLGKPSNRIKLTKLLCQDLPHIHLSGTAIVESPCSIYHQMYISRWTPFKFKNFYDFHRIWGIPYYIKAGGRDINQYDKYKPELLDMINKFTVYITQEDAGISSKLQAEDVVHYVTLNKPTKDLYNTLVKDKIAEVWTGMLAGVPKPDTVYDLVLDSTMKERTTLHMLESGVVKVGNKYIELGNTEKIDYIKSTFTDSKDLGTMSHFIGERELLGKHLKLSKQYSSNGHAEGVDLSHLKYFVIVSSDYSGTKFIQRRDRVVNLNGSVSTKVHHILVKGAISEQVYKVVSKKQDFNNSTYDSRVL